jgi:RNA polymerase sigma-70 factor (ECF subfamily)
LADERALAFAPPEETDEELLAEIAAGNRVAFLCLARRHTPRLLRLAWRYSGQAAAAEDIVQDALVRIWQRAGQWDGRRGSGKSWIDRIVVNLCFDRGRRLVPLVGLEAIADRPDQQIDAHESYTGRQLAAAVTTAIAGLPERQRMALALCIDQEITCAEGARHLGISIATMESLLQRARRTIRRQLIAAGFLEDK